MSGEQEESQYAPPAFFSPYNKMLSISTPGHEPLGSILLRQSRKHTTHLAPASLQTKRKATQGLNDRGVHWTRR